MPVGKRIRITESRKRADVEVEVTANGTFTHNITAGKHSGGQFQHHRHGAGIWAIGTPGDEFVSVIKGDPHLTTGVWPLISKTIDLGTLT